MLNKKLIFNLLGGGVAVVVTSFGGIKAKDTIDYKRKVALYSEIPNKFKLSSGLVGKDLYFPNYTDDAAWRRTYDYKYTQSNEEKQRAKFLNDFPSWQSFKEYCFAEARMGFEKCNETQGFCMDCSRGRDWEWDKNRNI